MCFIFRSRRHSQYPQIAASLPPMVSGSQESTVAVYTFLDEKTPYKLKLPGTQPTLRQFKDYLPKKGSFRFVFLAFYAIIENSNGVVLQVFLQDCLRGPWQSRYTRRNRKWHGYFAAFRQESDGTYQTVRVIYKCNVLWLTENVCHCNCLMDRNFPKFSLDRAQNLFNYENIATYKIRI